MARRTLTQAGFGHNPVDMFAPTRFRAARLHPRRDDDGHGDGTTVDTPDAPEPEQDTDEPEQPKSDDIDWKAMARKHEREAKANRAAAAELDKLKAAQMSDTEKSNAEREQAVKDAADARAELAVERAARKHGITADKHLAILAKVAAEDVDEVAKTLADTKPAPSRSGNEVGGDKKHRTPTTLADAVHAAYQR